MTRAFTIRLAGTALAAALLAPVPARADDGEDGPSYDDLLVYRGGGIGWWYTNRTALLRPSYRAGSSSMGVVAPPDKPARERARNALLAELASNRELVRSEAALALGRMGDVRDIATLARIVDDRDDAATRRTHRMAALGLGLLPRGDATQAAQARNSLLGALEDSRGKHDQFSYFWSNCAYALAMRGDATALPSLLDLRRKALAAVDIRTSIHTDVLGPMCYAMAALGGEMVLPEIEEHLRGTKAPDGGSKDSAWAACQALVRVGGDDAKRLLRDAAVDDRNVIRQTALMALGSVADAKDDASAKILRTAVAEDKNEVCRILAAISLGRTGHATAGPTLLPMLETAAFDQRPGVALGLGFLGRAAPNAALRDALAKSLAACTNEGELKALCVACGVAGVQAARARLAYLASDTRAPALSGYAAFALGLTGVGPEEQKVLHELVARPADYVASREAALALGMCRDHDVVVQLRDMLSRKAATDIERATAAICLGRVGDDSDIDFVLGLLAEGDMSTQLRACVVNGLGWLLDRTEGAALGRLAADSMYFGLVRAGSPDAIHDIQHLVD